MSKSGNKVLLGAATVAAALAGSHGVAQAATGNLTVQAVVVQAASITQTTKLDFGTITETITGASDTFAVPAIGPTAPGGKITVVGGSPSPGGISVSGQGGLTLDVTAAQTITLNEVGTGTMQVTNIHVKSAAAGGTQAIALPGTMVTTVSSIPIGGTLVVTNGQATGTYTGSIAVSANYQ